MNWLKFLLTDEENQWDIGILLWILGVSLFFYKSFMLPTFDMQAFGIGFAACLAGGAGLQWIRTKK